MSDRKDSDGRIVWLVPGWRDRYRPRHAFGRGFLGAAPWLSVALLVVMYVFLTQPYVRQPGIRVELPASPFGWGSGYGLRVAILSQERPEAGEREEILFFDDERYLVRDDAQMESLKERFAHARRVRPGTPLVIEADERVLHGTVIRVFNMAAAVGIKEINIATRPPRAGAP
jgi:biopolymer transport protein ExbD